MSRKKKIVAAIAATFVLGIAAASCAETPEEKGSAATPAAESTTEKTEPETTTENAEKPAETVTETVTPTPKPKPKPKPLTAGQENAIAAAEDYLETMPFSRSGLIEQLSSEYGSGFSKADATFAVNHIDVNWTEQAARAAKDYLETMPFSRSGLIEQLSSEYGSGFTHKQAVYGVNQTGL
jgi:predicted 3-demethylubiquinone-9 3-methyltransferase (glyoxalase superfamily)